MKKIKRFLAVIIAGIMGITFAIPTFAEEAADEKNGALKVYMDELSRINEELGTHYGIPVEYFDESELVPTVTVSADGGWRYSLILGHGAVLSALAANIDREIIFGDSI